MKQWQVKYYLGDMLHTYVVDAVNEFEATLKVLYRIPETSRNLFRTLSVIEYHQEWN